MTSTILTITQGLVLSVACAGTALVAKGEEPDSDSGQEIPSVRLSVAAPAQIDFQVDSVPAARRSGPILEIEPETHDFGIIDLGSSSGFLDVLVINSGDAPASDLTITVDSDFLVIGASSSCLHLKTGDLPPPPAVNACWVEVKMLGPASEGETVTGTLHVTSAEGAHASIELTGTGGEFAMLHGQLRGETMTFFIANLNAQFPDGSSHEQFNSELTDDFEVIDPAGWTISKVGLEVSAQQFEPPTHLPDILISADEDGVPGEDLVCFQEGAEIVLWESPRSESRVELAFAKPCELAPGHYWLRVHLHSASFDSEWMGWGLQYIDHSRSPGPVEPPSVHLNPPLWRNAGGGFGICTDWTPMVPSACGLEDLWWIELYGAVFWLIGQGEPASAGEMQIDPEQLEFDQVIVGETSTQHTLTLTNAGTDVVEISSISEVFEPFQHAGGTCPLEAFTLEAGESCSLEYVFSPTFSGLVDGLLLIQVESPPLSAKITLSGEGIKPPENQVFEDRFEL